MNDPAPTLIVGSALFLRDLRDPDHSLLCRSAGPRHSRGVTAGRHDRIHSAESLAERLTDEPDVALRVDRATRQSNSTRAGSAFIPHNHQFIPRTACNPRMARHTLGWNPLPRC